MSIREFTGNRWTRFSFWALLYTLWVAWLGNWWWIIGLAVIFDIFITKKVKWAFWKKTYAEGQKKDEANEWLDAVIFAVIVVTFINTFFFQAFKIPSSSMESTLYTGDHLFVSKLAYGPKLPQTPLTIPFTHNVAFGGESYSTLISRPYKRLKGFREVRRGDIVVFNFPNGDTVLKKAPSDDYYMLSRYLGRQNVLDKLGPVVVRPQDKKDHYVKRCVATPGDTLEVRNGLVWINGEAQPEAPGVQLTYKVKTAGRTYPSMELTSSKLEDLLSGGKVESVECNIESAGDLNAESSLSIFPYVEDYKWTRDWYGPVWIPSKGATVALTPDNIPLYSRIISVYEHSDLQKAIEEGEYTFMQNYYFMMGDNRHNSLDSRYWGFVPEDHIVGKPAMIWLSTDSGKRFPKNIRWGRFGFRYASK